MALTKINSTNATENGTNGIFTFTLDSPAPVGGLVVNYDTSGSSGSLNSDYALLAGSNISQLTANSFVIAAGATTATLTIHANSDTVIEGTESVNLNVSINTPSSSANFDPKVDVGTGSYPYSVSTGDFNGDGKLDLAVANFSGSTVSVLLRNATNTGFDHQMQIRTGSHPHSVSTGDFNGDGKLDLAVANSQGDNVSVLLRNATNTGFDPQEKLITGHNPYSVSTGDFNGDGKLDLAVANYGSDTVSILLRNAANTSFDPKVDVGTGDQPTSVSTGDFNGDGKLDLAVANANPSGTDSVLFNTTPSPSTQNLSMSLNVIDSQTLTGTAAADSLSGGLGNDILIGNAGNDTLIGNAGNDNINGSAGRDNLTGGAGADTFKFSAVSQTGIFATTRDTITDFKHSQHDKIDLSAIDANTNLADDQAFSFIDTAAFSADATGQLRFDAATHLVYGSNDADIAPEFSISLTGVTNLVAADFIL